VRDDLATLLSERFAASRPPVRGQVAAPPSARAGAPRPLPVDSTSLLGREQAIDEVAGLLEDQRIRLVTLTGPGGVGKTRLAVAVAQRLRDRFPAGTAFVPLATVTEPERVLATIGRAVEAARGTGSPREALVEQFGDDRWLLILDNLEQVTLVARDLAELLTRCPGVSIVTTSRTVLGLRAEREYPVPPLPPPPDPLTTGVAELAASPAVALFVDRAQAVHHDFALTTDNAPAVAEICRRLEGLPLAIELAAARTRLLDPDALLRRLAASLDALGTGPVDLPERQHTLRATVDWSVGLLEDAERSLLETMAVFVDGWTIDAAAEVARLDQDQALDLTEALARHSLIYLDTTWDGFGPRSRMLGTVRQFVAERLDARPDAAEVRRRHADCYRALADRADRPIRGVGQESRGDGQRHWVERLEAEAGNLAATVGWYLANDPAPLPHLFRVLWPFWSQLDHLGDVRAWIRQLLPSADFLDPQAKAELLWTALVTAREVGDDAVALSIGPRLAPLLDEIGDPYLHAASQLALAWIAPIVGDSDGALRQARASLEEFQRQDEPVGTASASLIVGAMEMTVGRHDDAMRRLTEARDLAARLDNAWLAATSNVLVGELALVRGRPGEALAPLGEGLDLSLAAHSTQLVSLCLAAVARVSLAEGDTDRAALLVGAAEGLRRRVGLRAWPSHRRGEAELIAQIRQPLGTDRFEQAFAAGARLNRREAVAAARDRLGTGARAS
jgi:predicted ATPase